MANVDIKIECIAQTRVNIDAIDKWLTTLGVSPETQNLLVDNNDVTDAALLIALAAKQCYMSFEVGMNPNVTKVRKDLVEFLYNILASGHGSVLEHVSFTFAIKNISRVFTGEMNRHRAGVAISEQSMRYIRFDEHVDWWMPPSLQHSPEDSDNMTSRKEATRAVFRRAFQQMEDNYRELVNLWDMDESDKDFHYKKTMTSCFRRIIGMGCATGGVWTLNVRALRHVLAIRTAPAAEEEIAYVCSRIAEYMINSEPMLFGDFTNLPNSVTTWIPKYQKV